MSYTVFADFDNQPTSPQAQAWFNDIQLEFLPSAGTVGDDNLLENPGFEYSYNQANWPDYWNTATGGGSAVWQSVAQGNTHAGQHGLTLTPAATGGSTESVTSMVQVPFNNQNFSLVGYVQTSGLAGNNAYIRIDALNSSGAILQSFPSTKVGAGGAPWTRLDVQVPASQMPSGTAYVTAAVAVDPDANGSSAVASFDDLLLTPSNLFDTLAYDSNNNYVTQATDQLGHSVQVNYSGSSNPSGFSSNFTGLNTGDPSQATDANGNTYSMTYNKLDELFGLNYPYQSGGTSTSQTVSYGYDSLGNLTSIQDPNGNKLMYQYNEFGLPVSETETVSGTPETTTASYNAGGLVTGVSEPNGTSQSLTYDAANRLTGVNDTKGSTSDSFSYSYDNVGNLLSAQNGTNAPYTFTYDALNRLNGTSQQVAGVNDSESFTMDPGGDVTGISYTLGNATPTTWSESDTYNSGGAPISMSDGNDSVQYTYTPRGAYMTVRDQNSNELTEYTYLPTGQMSEVKTLNKAGQVVQDYTYSYDANGNVTSIASRLSNPAVPILFSYDAQNQLTGEVTWTGYVKTYTYDNLGNRTATSSAHQFTQPDGAYVIGDTYFNGTVYKYVAQGTTTPTVTGGSNVTITDEGAASASGNQIHAYLITSSTPVTSITSGSYTQSTFNVLNGDIFWYGKWWNQGSAQTIPAGYDLSVAIGRTEDLGSSQWYASVDGVKTYISSNYTMHYFKAPISESSTHTIQFSYDSGGYGIQFGFWGYAKSPTTGSGGATANSYDPEGNRLTSVGSTSVTYDANGQMTANGSTNYAWNAENQLVQVTNGTQTDTYTYDPLGRRATVNGKNIGYVGQSDLVAYMADANNNLLQRFVYDGQGKPQLMYVNVGGTWKEYGYLYDEGQIRALIDDTPGSSTLGQAVVTYKYDAWGNLVTYSDSTGLNVYNQNPFIYHGYWYDWDTGLYYLNTRYYNPALGRFISEDPAAPSVGDVLSYNEYAYVENDPLLAEDLTGALPSFLNPTEGEGAGGMPEEGPVGSGWRESAPPADQNFGVGGESATNDPGVANSGKELPKGDSKSTERSSKTSAVQTYYPPNDGFLGKPLTITLEPGTLIDRYGYSGGKYAAPAGTEFGARALPPDSAGKPYTVYEVLKPIEVKSGLAAPWFGQPGLGIQYLFSQTIQSLVDSNVLGEVK